MMIKPLHKLLMATRNMAVVLVLCSLAPFAFATQPVPTDTAVQHLITYVARSNLTFVRNSEEYTGQEASAHMSKKYAHFRDRITTPEEFIELCATRSLLSGKPYRVIDGQGRDVRTADWLLAELQAYRHRLSGEPL